MRYTDRHVWAADLWQEGAPVDSAGPAAARCVSPDALLRGASIAWAHLQPEERKAVRATCRSGRQLHDSLTTHLRITLGQDPGQREQQQQGQQQQRRPSPRELRASLTALVRRGARLQVLTVWFRDASDGRREAQLVAALEACSGSTLSCLELEGAVPLSGAVAEAVATRCPHLSKLVLNYRKLSRPTDAVPARGAAAGYNYGSSQLLTLCGPRLRVLQLSGVHHWKAASYTALLRCTALTALVLDAGVEPDTCIRCERYVASPAVEAHVISTVAQLTTLESLRLLTSFDSASTSPEVVRPHATCVAPLSALTALTHLQLGPSECYGTKFDIWCAMQNDGDQHGAWCEVREAHRTSLLSALRAMPQLQHLHCPELWLEPNELAPLTALTSATLMGLLPPSQWEGRGFTGLPVAGCVPLPPHLQELVLPWGASPRAYAALQPAAAFSRLYAYALSFGMSDVTPDGRLRAEAVAAVGPAVRLLTTYRDPAPCPCFCLSIGCDGSSRLLQPRAGAPTGHMEWIQQLRGLNAFGSLEFYNIALSAGDLSCLGQTLSNLRDLELHNCSFPAVALPLLRNPMLRLRDLYLDFESVEGISVNSTLEPLLLVLLCRPHTGAAPLECLAITYCPSTVDAAQCVQSVTEQLEVCFGLTGVELSVECTEG